jgi:uncharacterized membrane protein YqhA
MKPALALSQILYKSRILQQPLFLEAAFAAVLFFINEFSKTMPCDKIFLFGE